MCAQTSETKKSTVIVYFIVTNQYYYEFLFINTLTEIGL